MTNSNDTLSLHTDRGIALATFLGSPLAGGLLLADNFRRLDRSGAALLGLAGGLLGTALLLAFGMAAGDRIPRGLSTAIAVLIALGARKLAGNLFRREYRGIEKGWASPLSMWIAAGVGIATIGAAFAAIVFLMA